MTVEGKSVDRDPNRYPARTWGGFVERYQTVPVVLAVLGGLAVGRVSGVPALAESPISLFLMVMLFGAFAAIPLSSLREAFSNRRVVGASLGIDFL